MMDYFLQLYGKSLQEILAVYNISIEEFHEHCDEYTNYDLFKTDSSGELMLRGDGSSALMQTSTT